MQVSENVHRLTQGVTNFYLIEESGKFTVIDAGTPGDWSYFRRSLAALGGSLTDLDAVLLTHAHPTTSGSLSEPARRQRRECGSTRATPKRPRPARPNRPLSRRTKSGVGQPVPRFR